MKAINWDFLIGALVIVGIVLIVWAKVSHQTVAEVLVDIKEKLFGGGEEVVEKAEEVVVYE